MLSFLLLFFLISPETGWKLLGQVQVQSKYSELYGEEIFIPIFSEELKRHDGKEIRIEGYVIPLQQSESQDYFVLSRFPYNSCFFCGNAGPETVAEVYTNDPFPYKDARVRVTGTLKLNASDPLQLFYTFTEADVELLE